MKLKRSVKRIFKITALLILIAYLSFVVIWAEEQNRGAVCRGVVVDIVNADSSAFITEKGIINDLKALKLDPTGKNMSKINTDKIEKSLNELDYFEDVQCIIDNKHNLVIKVKQILPVMRIFEKNSSFYINKDGKKMKADARYHINVPIVSGNFNENFKPTYLLPLFEYVDKNPVLDTYITMVMAKDSNNIIIIPNIDGHVINFGDIKNIESKFEKIKQMYAEVMPVKGWYTYDTISVKWDYQIVATRRNKKIAETMELAEDDEPDPDLGTMLTNSAPISSDRTEDKQITNQAIENKPKVDKPKADKPKVEEKKESSDKKKTTDTKKPSKENSKERKQSNTERSKADKKTKDAFSQKPSTTASEKKRNKQI